MKTLIMILIRFLPLFLVYHGLYKGDIVFTNMLYIYLSGLFGFFICSMLAMIGSSSRKLIYEVYGSEPELHRVMNVFTSILFIFFFLFLDELYLAAGVAFVKSIMLLTFNDPFDSWLSKEESKQHRY